jgi:ABC-2 type transport system permease protein
MTGLIKSEFRKLFTTQVWFWLLLASIAITALFVVAQCAPGDGVRDYNDAVGVFTSSGTAYIAVFVLGVLGVTTEYRYQTITPTILATPSRWALITAKMITYAIVGALYALACVIIQVAMALHWLSAKGKDLGFHISLISHDVPRALLSVFAVVLLFGILGLGIGALLRNQIVAVSVGVIWLLVINNVLLIIPGVKYVYPYTPGGAVNGIFTITGDRVANHVTLPSAPVGILVLLIWAFGSAIIGASLTMNRDIT